MYKVLLVEDEMLIRVGLKNSIPWTKYEMEVIADASNGHEALKIYNQDKPDLIITDLKMPVMDGLELISAIRENDRDTKIIILSCIEDFEYARKAVSLQVSGYILKLTMTMDEMEKVLSMAYTELKSRNPFTPLSKNHQLNLHVLKEKLLKDYLFYGTYSESELADLLKQMESRIKPGKIVISILETNQYSRLLERFDGERGELIHFTILNILNEILSNHKAGEAFHDRDNRYLLFYSFDWSLEEKEIHAKLSDIFENIQNAMKTYFDIPVFISVSSISQGFSSLRKRYKECVAMMETRYFASSPVAFASEFRPENQESQWKRLVSESSKVWESLGSPFLQELEKEVKERMEQPLNDEQSWKQLFLGLIDWTFAYLRVPDDHATLMEFSGIERIKASLTIEESIQAWESHLAEMAKVKAMIKSVSKEVADAVQFIHQRYDQDISLKEISEYVNLSSNYLSMLFKKEMGSNLIEFLTNYRLEKAKELLLHTSLKTYEIAENVGVPDSAYFSRIFKKSTGVSPIDFRKKKVIGRKAGPHENA